MELADVTDSKSVDGDIVWVRVPPPAPAKKEYRSVLLFCCLGRWARIHCKLPARLPRSHHLGATCCRACSAGFRVPPPAPAKKEYRSVLFFVASVGGRESTASCRHASPAPIISAQLAAELARRGSESHHRHQQKRSTVAYSFLLPRSVGENPLQVAPRYLFLVLEIFPAS